MSLSLNTIAGEFKGSLTLVEARSMRRSALTHPIHKLPTIVLRYFFSIATNYDMLLLVALHDTFPTWGDLIVSSPSLWRQINVLLDETDADTLSTIEMALLLSQDAPLSVDIRGTGGLNEILVALAPHWARIRHFILTSYRSRLVVPVDCEDALVALAIPTKSWSLVALPFTTTLTSLHFSPIFDIPDTGMPHPAIPHVTYFPLDDDRDYSFKLTFPPVESVALKSLNLLGRYPSSVYLNNVLKCIACPNLHSLAISWTFWPDEPPLHSFLQCIAWASAIHTLQELDLAFATWTVAVADRHELETFRRDLLPSMLRMSSICKLVCHVPEDTFPSSDVGAIIAAILEYMPTLQVLLLPQTCLSVKHLWSLPIAVFQVLHFMLEDDEGLTAKDFPAPILIFDSLVEQIQIIPSRPPDELDVLRPVPDNNVPSSDASNWPDMPSNQPRASPIHVWHIDRRTGMPCCKNHYASRC